MPITETRTHLDRLLARRATLVDYDGSESGLSSTDVQSAIDEVAASSGIADGAVTTPKLADGAVNSTKLGAGAVETSNILNFAVTSEKIATGAIDNAAILVDDVVTADKLSPVLGTVFETGSTRDMVVGDLGRMIWFNGTTPTYELKNVAPADTGVLVFAFGVSVTLSDATVGVTLLDASGNGTTVAANTFAYIYAHGGGMFRRLV